MQQDPDNVAVVFGRRSNEGGCARLALQVHGGAFANKLADYLGVSVVACECQGCLAVFISEV